MPFKIRHEQLGGHTHCTWFHRSQDNDTWQNCGTIVVSVSHFFELQRTMRDGFEFEETKRETVIKQRHRFSFVTRE